MHTCAALSVWRKAAFVPPLLFALWLLTDDEKTRRDNPHHLAVWTALNRHPPSWRVFRALLELTLLLFGAALSMHVWITTVGTQVTGTLLFQPPKEEQQQQQQQSRVPKTYQLLAAQEEEIETLDLNEALHDVDYDSDGEVNPPPRALEPPSASSICSAALDLLLLIMICLFLFTLSSAEGGRFIDGVPDNSTPLQSMASIAAPIFPLLLFLATLTLTLLPWKRRKHFWIILSHTIGAPFYNVTFRDGFLGDILTSSVRPLQDLCFTSFYVFSGLQGWWTRSYSIDEAATPIEHSWILRTCLLPACMVSPLWWRFSQNLRQAYDTKQRWPFLGNALKYLVAAEVAMFGVFSPARQHHTTFLLAFVGSTLYQVWWDVFMDWELLEWKGGKAKLRSKRLYSSKIFYWTIFVLNFFLRFCWTLSFMPQRYLTKAGVLQTTSDLTKFLGPAIASAEIIRRTLWGLLRFELEAIKSCGEVETMKIQLKRCSDATEDGGIEMQAMKLGDDVVIKGSLFGLHNDLSGSSDLTILRELVVWATIFCSCGILAAAHRETY